MGMILLPVCIVLVIFVIAVVGLLKKGDGGSFFGTLCLVVVGIVLFIYFVLPFYSDGH